MTVAQIEAREDFCRRILELPDEGFLHVKQYFDDMLPHLMSSHIPNEETAAALRESADMRNLIGPFNNVEDFMKSLLSDDDA